MKKHLILKLLLILCCTSHIMAKKQNYLSRFGSPKYAEKDFKHFDYVNPKAPKEGRLKLSTIGTFDSLNKDAIKGIRAEGLPLTYDTLMVRSADEPFTLYGLIAKQVEVSDDYSTVTFFINPKAEFNDGTPVTAEDVKFTYELLRDKALPRYRQHYSRILKFEIPDAHTIRMHLSKGKDGKFSPELPMILALEKVLPKNQLEGIDFTNTGLLIIQASGPYKISNVDQGRSITYKRNPNYWAKDLPISKGMYNFNEIKIDYYKNAQAQFQGFLAGEFDMYFETNSNNWRDGYDVKQVKIGQIKKVQEEHERPVAVKMMIMNMRRPLFKDFRLRKALVMSFDADTVNRVLLQNAMKIPNSLFANTVLAHHGPAEGLERELLTKRKHDISPYFYEDMLAHAFEPAHTDGHGNQRKNLAIASELLNEAGWPIGKGGLRRNSFGQPLIITIAIKDPKLEKIALNYRESLRKIGITLKVRMFDAVQYENRVIDSDFDMIIHTWANSLSPGNEQVYYFNSANAYIKGSSNYIGLKDDVAEDLAIEITKVKEYPELVSTVHALDRYIMHLYLQVPLFYDNTTRYAYWFERIGIPTLSPKVGLNIMNWGWQKKDIAASISTNNEPSMWQNITSWFKGLFSKK